MKIHFPLKDVIIKEVTTARKVDDPVYADGFWQMNQNEFSMQVEGVGSYYACNGNEVEYAPLPSATPESVELYLNGSVYGAVLHQRKILPLHGSCFIEQGMGVMLCGDSGTGKSSLTAAFCRNGSEFLTDDVTPVIFKNKKPLILALSDRIKLWDNTFGQLNIDKTGLKRIDPETDKYYYNIDPGRNDIFSLGLVFILKVYEETQIGFTEIHGAEKYLALRNELYRPEYLKGMPENEKALFMKLADMGNNVRIFNVNRPTDIPVLKLMSEIKGKISSVLSESHE